jgi:GDP-mannose 6-dehydrogenase
VDIVRQKIQDLKAGRSPIREPEVSPLLREALASGRLHATDDPELAVRHADMAWITVGTPSLADGKLDASAVLAVTTQVGQAIRATGKAPLIVLRSTVLPGTTRDLIGPELERASGLRLGRDMSLVFHPEFLREGVGVEDFDHPSRVVIGEDNAGAGDYLARLYEGNDRAVFRVTSTEAELVKYCDNAFHAVKTTFSNEMGRLARALGVDGRRVADLFLADSKLNISRAYLRPGFAYGGSCLPKDMRAILRRAAELSVSLPMLETVPISNARLIDDLVDRVLALSPKSAGLVGLSFKHGTDDMRESPFVVVAKRLIGEGIRVRIYDPGVDPANLIGSNKRAVQANLRHLEELLVSSAADLDSCDVVLLNHPTVDAEQVQSWIATGTFVLDLVGVPGLASRNGYEGIAW